MSKFGLYGKITAYPGQRDALVAGLLEAAALMQHVPGCELYIVNISATEPDAVWVTEVWSSPEAHRESLTKDEVKALIKRLAARHQVAAQEQPWPGIETTSTTASPSAWMSR